MLSILHVDDQPIDRRLVRHILSTHGHASAEACSGVGALASLARQRFDVVLMDINMPGVDGVEVVRLLRRAVGPARHTPVIACTAETRFNEAHYRACGFDGLVTKPFSDADVMQAIHRCLGAPGEAALAARRVA